MATADALVVNGYSNDDNETSPTEQDMDSDEEMVPGSDDVEQDD